MRPLLLPLMAFFRTRRARRVIERVARGSGFTPDRFGILSEPGIKPDPHRRARRGFAFAAIGCGLLALCAGAEEARASTAEPTVVSLRVLSFEGLVTDLAVRSPRGCTRIVARASAFSRGIDALAEDGFVSFFNYPPPSPPAPGATKPAAPETPAVRFTVEPGVDRYLVIVSATGAGAGRAFSAYAIPDAGDALPLRHARVINFTDAPLAVRLGASSAVVAAAHSSVLPCPPGPDGHADLRLARPAGEGKWELVDSTRVAVPDGRRLLVLVTPAPKPDSTDMVAGGLFNVRVVFDAAPPAGPVALAHRTTTTP